MAIDIVPYHKSYSKAFYNLNIEWLKIFFYVEPFDEQVLSKPEHFVINKDGFIFFAKEDEIILGTLALMPTLNPFTFELTKMAVLPNQRGKNIGQLLMRHAIDFAQSNKFKSLVLYSNTKLENAIYIYRKFGFVELELEKNSPYKCSNIKMALQIPD